MVPPGSYTFGPHNGRILVKTYRDGLAKKVGHDLVIEVGRWSATVDVAEDPADTTITGTADVRSLKPIEGIGGVKPLSDDDKSEIKKNIEKIIPSPEISFRATSIKVGSTSATVTGDLTIMGRSAPVDVQMNESGGRVRGGFSVVQSRWGIKPFSAMMGALKVKDQVDIELDVDLPA